MKRRLNLFTQQASAKHIVNYYAVARKIALSFFLFCILIAFSLIGYFFYLSNQRDSIKRSAQNYSLFILSNEQFSVQIQEFVFKYKILTGYISQDAQAYRYYLRLAKLIQDTPPPAKISSFSIDSTRVTSIILTFNSYEEAILFVNQMEQPVFLDVFETITLEGFDITSTSTTSYQLSLSGIFKPLNKDGSS